MSFSSILQYAMLVCGALFLFGAWLFILIPVTTLEEAKDKQQRIQNMALVSIACVLLAIGLGSLGG